MPESNTGESVPRESVRRDRVALSDEIMLVGQKPGCPSLEGLAV